MMVRGSGDCVLQVYNICYRRVNLKICFFLIVQIFFPELKNNILSTFASLWGYRGS